MSKIVAINASPRGKWNTAMLVQAAAEGAKEKGAEVEYFDIYQLEKFTGCLSCFACKTEQYLGKCVFPDGLEPVLEAIRNADGLIIGTPIYIGNATAGFLSLFERLIFQAITYKKDIPTYNDRQIPVTFIVTSNCPLEAYEEVGYNTLIADIEKKFAWQVGPVKTLISAETMQVNDYESFGWDIMDPESRRQRRKDVFPLELAQARELGAQML